MRGWQHGRRPVRICTRAAVWPGWAAHCRQPLLSSTRPPIHSRHPLRSQRWHPFGHSLHMPSDARRYPSSQVAHFPLARHLPHPLEHARHRPCPSLYTVGDAGTSHAVSSIIRSCRLVVPSPALSTQRVGAAHAAARLEPIPVLALRASTGLAVADVAAARDVMAGHAGSVAQGGVNAECVATLRAGAGA